MICLDSDFLISLLRGDKDAEHVAKELEISSRLATTPINYFEILSGALLSSKADFHAEQARQLLLRLELLNFGKNEAELISTIHSKAVKKGRPIPLKDLFIGSIALSSNATLVTRNTKDFSRIPGLKLTGW